MIDSKQIILESEKQVAQGLEQPKKSKKQMKWNKFYNQRQNLLLKKPCKNYFINGFCKYGSKCFRIHREVRQLPEYISYYEKYSRNVKNQNKYYQKIMETRLINFQKLQKIAKVQKINLNVSSQLSVCFNLKTQLDVFTQIRNQKHQNQIINHNKMINSDKNVQMQDSEYEDLSYCIWDDEYYSDCESQDEQVSNQQDNQKIFQKNRNHESPMTTSKHHLVLNSGIFKPTTEQICMSGPNNCRYIDIGDIKHLNYIGYSDNVQHSNLNPYQNIDRYHHQTASSRLCAQNQNVFSKQQQQLKMKKYYNIQYKQSKYQNI